MTIRFVWADPEFAARHFWDSCTIEAFDNPFFSLTEAWKAVLSTLVAFAYALYILAYPPKYKKLSILLLGMPVFYAFCYGHEIAPSFTVCDTFVRFVYIWYANMSYEVTILEWSPRVTKEIPGTWKTRLAQAYKVLFARENHQNVLDGKPRHNHCRLTFCLLHLRNGLILYVAQNAYYILSWYYVIRTQVHGADKAIFFRRLPHSFNVDEIFASFDNVMHWCIINLWLYEAFHSFFAILFVGSGLDKPGEWSMSLFNSISEAYTVRRYWGKHWHNYIYASFSGHTKILTRKWLRMRRGSLVTRLVENTVVFAASGLLHSLVRFVQDPQSADYMCISLWYIGQMAPIIIEDIVMTHWQRMKQRYGFRNIKWLTRFERTVGYLWVLGFNMWSITKYIHTRSAWSEARFRKKYAAELELWNITEPEEGTLEKVEL
jgi:hypothetical protein